MNGRPIKRYRTALKRVDLSRPARRALQDGILSPSIDLLDYGCGHGTDVALLAARGIVCRGWDPAFRSDGELSPADVVTLSYVINVIEDPDERSLALQRSWSLAKQVLIVSAQVGNAIRGRAIPYGDGVVTGIGTFQKLYAQRELKEYIEAQLGTEAIAAEPGIFYVFRTEADRQQYVASRFRGRITVPRRTGSEMRYHQNRELLDAFGQVIASLGRLPNPDEWPRAREIIERFGSLKRAFGLIRRGTGDEPWEQLARRRRDDLVVFLALARFRRRPPLSRLPSTIRRDVRFFFGTYMKACGTADELLFNVGDPERVDESCRVSAVGKLLPTALYCHRSAVGALDPLLRVYEGCARMYLGEVEGATLVKLHRRSGKVSYLVYPNFETDPHPALLRSVKLSLRTQEAEWRDYSGSKNPPVLHRKETFLASDDPRIAKYRKLTRREEAAGLLSESSAIGTREGWRARLAEFGYELRGHRLVRRSPL